MKNYLQQYKVKLTLRGPVFVGNGKEYSKKEYLFLPQKRLGILDIERLYKLMGKEKRIPKFEAFMMSSGKGNDIGRWLDDEGLREKAEKTCIAYSLSRGDTKLEKDKRKQIMACIKDPYGNPYIPGSSLKGMLRTIIAADRLLQNDTLREKTKRNLQQYLPTSKGRKNCLSKMVSTLEEDIFRTMRREHTRPKDAVNDTLSGFIVSDSEPINPDRLILAQKVERRPDGTENPLNLLRESICPGTEIHFTITIDHSVCPITKERLLKAIESFDNDYSENFLKAYKDIDRLTPPQVYVGGGTGFCSKTLVYPLMGRNAGVRTTVEIFNKTGVPFHHKHKNDTAAGVSPHIVKCTWYQGKTIQMGLCDISIE